ncbi:MAG: hypothetical protein CMB99_16230 [Flavobacteriaceae bacterium]|nr:hypothetical protein [Flavobacteriaceae bacterium]
MARLTKKKICEAVESKFGLPRGSVELGRWCNCWYWAGACAVPFSETGVSAIKLNDWKLELWLEDFADRVDSYQQLHLKPYIDYVRQNCPSEVL